jgi:cytochrome c
MAFAPPMAAGILVLLAGVAIAAFGLSPGDRTRGERVYSRCFACHAIDRDRTGPRHAGLFGRRAGSLPGFAYSPAMRKAGMNGLIWNEETLDRFLQSPTKFIPGNRMGYAGVADAQDRADLLAYLRAATHP